MYHSFGLECPRAQNAQPYHVRTSIRNISVYHILVSPTSSWESQNQYTAKVPTTKIPTASTIQIREAKRDHSQVLRRKRKTSIRIYVCTYVCDGTNMKSSLDQQPASKKTQQQCVKRKVEEKTKPKMLTDKDRAELHWHEHHGEGEGNRRTRTCGQRRHLFQSPQTPHNHKHHNINSQPKSMDTSIQTHQTQNTLSTFFTNTITYSFWVR